MRAFALIAGLLVLACGAGRKDVPRDDSGTDADADTDADTDTDTDTDTGDFLEPTTEEFTASFSGQGWEAEEGHWLPGSLTYVVGIDSDVEVQLVLDGDPRDGGSLGIKEASWYKTIHNGYEFKYEGEGGGAKLVVDGLDRDRDFLWAHLEGSISMTDTEGSGAPVTLEALELVSWQRYGAK